MTELHIEIDSFPFEKALYCASLAKVKYAGFLYSDLSLSKAKVQEVKKILREMALLYDIEVMLGAKLMHIPPQLIEDYINRQREKGYDYICVHGENIYDNIEAGTNLAAVSGGADLLLNPGFLDDNLIEYATEMKTAFEFNTHPLYASGNHLLAHYAKSSLGAKLNIVWGNTIKCEKDFIYSVYQRESAKISLKGYENDLIKKLKQDTFTLVQTRIKHSF